MEHSHNEIQHGLARPRKRRKRWQRETWTCSVCRLFHRKCNGKRPCDQCSKFGCSGLCVDHCEQFEGNVRMETNTRMQGDGAPANPSTAMIDRPNVLDGMSPPVVDHLTDLQEDAVTALIGRNKGLPKYKLSNA